MSLHRRKFSNKISTRRDRIDFAVLRSIPILDVARTLGMEIARTGADTYNMRDGREITSLVLFVKSNTWFRYSGKELGGVNHGSTIDLVMHIRECPLSEAALFLSTNFPSYR